MNSGEDSRKYTFSIIIPFHNQGEHLIDAVESCIRQSVGFDENIEIILADDASTDIGPYIAEIYTEKYPENIRLLTMEGCLISETRKRGRELARGKYSLFLNADDLLDDEALENVKKEAAAKPEKTAFVLASCNLEKNDFYPMHPIQANDEVTVYDKNRFRSGMDALDPDVDLSRMCVVYPAEDENVQRFVFIPGAVLRTRLNRRDLGYDFTQNLLGSRQDPPYTKEDVRRELFQKANYVAEDKPEFAEKTDTFLFSIVMPVYNCELYLDEAIRSILDQTIGFEKNIQMILVDDGSPDGSGAICDKYAGQYPENIRVIHQQNSGPSFARYNGLQLAKGKYVNFLDSDDYLSLDTLEKVANYFAENPDVDLAAIPLFYVGTKTGGHPNNNRFSGLSKTADMRIHWEFGQTNLPACFIRRRAMSGFSYDPGLRVSEDYHQLMKLQLQNPLIGLVGRCRYYYRRFDDAASSLSTDLYKKPDFFTPSLERVFLDIIRLARARYGIVPRYIQSLLFRDLVWRLKIRNSFGTCLSEEELPVFLSVTAVILSQIEREVIFGKSAKIDYASRNRCVMMKENGILDLYPAMIKKSFGVSPVDIWFNEIPAEASEETYFWLIRTYGRDRILAEARKRKKKMDPAGIVRGRPEYSLPELFGNHSCDTAVRIWRNEVPDWNSMYVYDWMCSRYGESELARSLHYLLSRLPSKLPRKAKARRRARKMTEVIHNAGVLGKLRGGLDLIRENGLVWTGAEYINNIFFYKYKVLKKQIVVPGKQKESSPKDAAVNPGEEPLPIILFESNPDLTNNTWCIFMWMLKRGLNNKYKMVWAVDKPEAYTGLCEKNVSFVKKLSDEQKDLKLQAAATVSCNRFIFANPEEGQIALFLTHGSPLKVSPLYSYGVKFNYVLSQSEWLKPYVSYENDTPIDSLRVLGIPRNDALFHPNDALGKMGITAYNKVILWMPTYRQHKDASGNSNKIVEDMPMGIPVLRSPEDAERLNALLKEHNILLILKPHPAQDLSGLKAVELSNFRIIYNDELAARNVLLYELLGASAAMITDYSSVYYDYLLTGNPIGLTMDDFDVYNSGRGFVYKDPYEILKGHRISTLEDMEAFVTNLSEGTDPYKEERQKVNDLVNTYQDDRSTERVGKFLAGLLEKQQKNASGKKSVS